MYDQQIDVPRTLHMQRLKLLSKLFFSEEDEEVFEDNPEEYIRRDIEGSGMLRKFRQSQTYGVWTKKIEKKLLMLL